jgi:hypothetical protein
MTKSLNDIMTTRLILYGNNVTMPNCHNAIMTQNAIVSIMTKGFKRYLFQPPGLALLFLAVGPGTNVIKLFTADSYKFS